MKILLAIDGSEFSDRAVKAVAEGAWTAGGAVKIISAVAPVFLPAADGVAAAPQFYEEIERVAREQARLNLEAAAARIRAGGGKALAVETEIIMGPPKQVILDAAEAWGADLIVVGSHGRGFWGRALLGSVSQGVASHAKCPVLIAR